MRKLLSFLFLFIAIESAVAADISGTWRGVMTSNEESGEVEVVFSPAGNPVYTYTNNSGVTREVELTKPGQTIEYVPPGGGVQRVVVDAIDKQPARVVLSLTGSFEKSSQGILDQQRGTTLIEYALVPEGLHMRMRNQNTAHFGDKDGMVGGTPTESVAEGILEKVR